MKNPFLKLTCDINLTHAYFNISLLCVAFGNAHFPRGAGAGAHVVFWCRETENKSNINQGG